MRIKIIETISLLVIGLLKILLSLPDAAFLFLLKTINVITRIIKKEIPSLVELIEITQKDKQVINIFRNMILKANNLQLFYLLRGALIHQAEFLGCKINLPSPQQLKKSKISCLNVGICGDNPDLEFLSFAYKDAGCNIIHYSKIEDVVKDGCRINILETSVLPEYDVFDKILSSNIFLSLHFSCITSPEIFEKTISKVKKFRIFYPYFYYPPITLTKKMLEDKIIGMVHTIRIKSIFSYSGGKLHLPEIKEDTFFSHPAFDHFLLLTFLGGEIEREETYFGKIRKDGGGVLISCKFSAPLKYGLLECVFSPEMYIYSRYFPYLLEIEIAGSDGIIFVNCNAGGELCEAPLRLRVGKRYYPFGIESFLESTMESIYSSAVNSILQNRERMNFQEIESAITLKYKLYKELKPHRT